jgi:serine/threonine-protein kinase
LSAALEGRERIAHELGPGGMAIVYFAHDLRHDRPVALKVLRADVAQAAGGSASCARSASRPGSTTRTSPSWTQRTNRGPVAIDMNLIYISAS